MSINMNTYNQDFTQACEQGDVKDAQWFLDHYPAFPISHQHFVTVTRRGDMELVKLLAPLVTDPDEYDTYNAGFVLACQNGYLELAQWLAENYEIDNVMCAFYGATSGGHIEMAQWLIRTWPEINPSGCRDRAIRYACRNGHLGMAQWLVTLEGVNPRANHDEALYEACCNGHITVVQWLRQSYPEIDFTNSELLNGAMLNNQHAVIEWLRAL